MLVFPVSYMMLQEGRGEEDMWGDDSEDLGGKFELGVGVSVVVVGIEVGVALFVLLDLFEGRDLDVERNLGAMLTSVFVVKRIAFPFGCGSRETDKTRIISKRKRQPPFVLTYGCEHVSTYRLSVAPSFFQESRHLFPVQYWPHALGTKECSRRGLREFPVRKRHEKK